MTIPMMPRRHSVLVGLDRNHRVQRVHMMMDDEDRRAASAMHEQFRNAGLQPYVVHQPVIVGATLLHALTVTTEPKKRKFVDAAGKRA
jgi:hypothetical protein